METISIQLESDTIALVDQLRQQNGLRPRRSQYIRSLIEQHVEQVTGESRLAALKQLAAANMENTPVKDDDLSSEHRNIETDVPGHGRPDSAKLQPRAHRGSNMVHELTTLGGRTAKPVPNAAPALGEEE